MNRLLIASLLSTLALVAGFGLGLLPQHNSHAADAAVNIQGFAFAPANVAVNVGDSVTWTNSDTVPHTATADDGSFNTGNLNTGASGSVTFNTAGTFAYFCAIHPSMRGTVVVTAASSGGGTTPAAGATTPASGGGTGAPAAGTGQQSDNDSGLPRVFIAGGAVVLVAGASIVALRRAR
ncbi:MAG: cupredoxin family copper-binding protein [Dehalococcoidia bacterium]|nr:cupredoxin family copper-binding protein [Dehalococcoidia bacterium]